MAGSFGICRAGLQTAIDMTTPRRSNPFGAFLSFVTQARGRLKQLGYFVLIWIDKNVGESTRTRVWAANYLTGNADKVNTQNSIGDA